MGELLFIATTVFVAYVVYTAIGGNKDNPEHTASQPDPAPESVATDPEPAAPAENPPPPPPPPKPVAAKPTVKAPAKATTAKTKAAPAKKAKPASAPATDSVKNPKTGEVAKLPGNYAFAKRWIKEALVEEGLLDKIYKNNELDDDATAKIQAALQELKAMKKYQ
ncbi:hypothetical protein [Methylomonas methanica]|uniref:Uncharacterized protein n=1 Tax=Methylomonas methanica (strain DSM 25384 / MC09) TaxID=857087 RepID=G0A357_METMM|nr:hypothetical protein [Methylomonas methanica]AEF98989.1 hypothetical protein Metme_0545 [Methylomonas methanica MC09]